MSKIYSPFVVQERIDEIQVANNFDTSGLAEENENENDTGYGSVCCSPQYSKATFVGCTLAIFQQLTGINFIMFYSNVLFSDIGMSPTLITGLVGVVNFLSTFGGLLLLSFAGRRTIMLWMGAAIAVILVLDGWFSLEKSTYPSVACTMLFIAAFEFSSGPITWLYMAEIMQDKAVSIATVLNWSINLIISLVTPKLINKIGQDNIGYIFIVCGGFTVLGTLFMFFFMKETRGKTQAQIEEMFMRDGKFSEKKFKKQLMLEDEQF
mmetsp:Transcript_102/g.198  ORF Transcript_102/g.198 Transcript_102/m.198 type:complete len:265 (-) Transcript_102:19-813(-)